MAKKSKIKKPRRAFDRASLFPRREAQEIGLKYYLIKKAIPDPVKRKDYIHALIEGIETEPILEIT